MSSKQGGKLEGNATRKLLKCTSSMEAELKKLPSEKYNKKPSLYCGTQEF